MEIVAVVYFIIRLKTEMIKIGVVLHELVKFLRSFQNDERSRLVENYKTEMITYCLNLIVVRNGIYWVELFGFIFYERGTRVA
jgi:hypothetical protein